MPTYFYALTAILGLSLLAMGASLILRVRSSGHHQPIESRALTAVDLQAEKDKQWRNITTVLDTPPSIFSSARDMAVQNGNRKPDERQSRPSAPTLPVPRPQGDDRLLRYISDQLAILSVGLQSIAGRMAFAESQLQELQESKTGIDWGNVAGTIATTLQAFVATFLLVEDWRERKRGAR